MLFLIKQMPYYASKGTCSCVNSCFSFWKIPFIVLKFLNFPYSMPEYNFLYSVILYSVYVVSTVIISPVTCRISPSCPFHVAIRYPVLWSSNDISPDENPMAIQLLSGLTVRDRIRPVIQGVVKVLKDQACNTGYCQNIKGSLTNSFKSELFLFTKWGLINKVHLFKCTNIHPTTSLSVWVHVKLNPSPCH